jgi:hypothetical protein
VRQSSKWDLVRYADDEIPDVEKLAPVVRKGNDYTAFGELFWPVHWPVGGYYFLVTAAFELQDCYEHIVIGAEQCLHWNQRNNGTPDPTNNEIGEDNEDLWHAYCAMNIFIRHTRCQMVLVHTPQVPESDRNHWGVLVGPIPFTTAGNNIGRQAGNVIQSSGWWGDTAMFHVNYPEEYATEWKTDSRGKPTSRENRGNNHVKNDDNSEKAA